jgi:FkbM family methyltransferase
VKILGRRPRNVAIGLLSLHQYILGCLRCFREFENPVQVVWSYIRRVPPPSGLVRLKNGWTIHLSNDPADIVTAVVVFARYDYGDIAPGSRVVDVGANIGTFALYAAKCGAASVVAYEPSAESFACLERNIRENGLERTVTIHRLAVASKERQSVLFPRRSSVMNMMLAAGEAGGTDEVATTTLDAIVRSHGRVDFVKLDCEGAEYEILFGAEPETLRAISILRLEYHQGRRLELVEHVGRLGLVPTRLTADNAIGGVIWFARRDHGMTRP